MRGSKDFTVRTPGRSSTFKITWCRHCQHCTSSERTPFSRMLARSIRSIGSSERLVAIVNPLSFAITNLEHAAPFLCVEQRRPRDPGPARSAWGWGLSSLPFDFSGSDHRRTLRVLDLNPVPQRANLYGDANRFDTMPSNPNLQ